MKTKCFECSQKGNSCCKGTQICLTTGDVVRISRFLDACNFFTIETADLVYMDPGEDPGWITLTIRPDGRRRVLRRTVDKSCAMLGENGCLLPMFVRPLVCRLYPYLFTEAGIWGVDPTCPISRELDWTAVLQQLGMAMIEARKWHRALYCELRLEKPSSPEKTGRGLHPESEKLAA